MQQLTVSVEKLVVLFGLSEFVFIAFKSKCTNILKKPSMPKIFGSNWIVWMTVCLRQGIFPCQFKKQIVQKKKILYVYHCPILESHLSCWIYHCLVNVISVKTSSVSKQFIFSDRKVTFLNFIIIFYLDIVESKYFTISIFYFLQ